VLPRMYSFGCCRSFRMPLLHGGSAHGGGLGHAAGIPYHTKMNSCFNFPWASSLGQIS
jgi:hypothetical protein